MTAELIFAAKREIGFLQNARGWLFDSGGTAAQDAKLAKAIERISNAIDDAETAEGRRKNEIEAQLLMLRMAKIQLSDFYDVLTENDWYEDARNHYVKGAIGKIEHVVEMLERMDGV